MTCSNVKGIADIKQHLHTHFVTKDMGKPRYFLGIEFAYANGRMALSQRKYLLDLLHETDLLGCKPESTPIEQTPAFWDSSSDLLEDPSQYKRLIGKLIYLTRLDISYAVSLLSQFMHKPRKVHWTGVLRVLSYVKGVPGKSLVYRRNGHTMIITYSDSGYAGNRGDRKSIFGFCTYVGGNIITWRSKKQNVVSRSSAETEYKSMTQTACEMIWIKSLLEQFGFGVELSMSMWCDNQAAIFIANNPTFHERTKHIEVDCHYVRDFVMKGVISTPYTQSSEQLADIFTKA